MILVAGESLIDLIPQRDGAALCYRASPGGSPFNVALALGRLGAPVKYLCPFSRDQFGELLKSALASSQVAVDLCPRTDQLTTLGFVSQLDTDGSARYAFYTEGTAGCGLQMADVPNPVPVEVSAIHVGSFAIDVEPFGTALEALILHQEHDQRIVSVDPNVRPFLVRDPERYRNRLARFLGVANLIKLSEEDLEWLHPGLTPPRCCERYLTAGASLVVVTCGARGALLMNGRGRHHCPPERIEVVDTIGAGDTFQAALLAWLHREGCNSGEALDLLNESDLEALGTFAGRAAAINCSRAGCNPPWAVELTGTRPMPASFDHRL